MCCYYLIKSLVCEDGWLTIHLLDRHLGVSHHHISGTQQSPGNLRLSVHNISKLDLLLSKLLLVLLQPLLIVLDEEVDGVAFRKESRSEGGILHITGDWTNHQLLSGAPPGVWGGTSALEPIFSHPMLVGQSNQAGVLHIIQAGLHWVQTRLLEAARTHLLSQEVVLGETAGLLECWQNWSGNCQRTGDRWWKCGTDRNHRLHGWLLGNLRPRDLLWTVVTAGLVEVIHVPHLIADLKQRDPVGQVGDVSHDPVLANHPLILLLVLNSNTQVLIQDWFIQASVQISFVGERTAPKQWQPQGFLAAVSNILILVRVVDVLPEDVILEGGHWRMLGVEAKPRVERGATSSTGLLLEASEKVKVVIHACRSN